AVVTGVIGDDAGHSCEGVCMQFDRLLVGSDREAEEPVFLVVGIDYCEPAFDRAAVDQDTPPGALVPPGQQIPRPSLAVLRAGVLPAVHGGLAVKKLKLLELAADKVHGLLGELAQLLGDPAVAPEIVPVRAVGEIRAPERGEIEAKVTIPVPAPRQPADR